MLVAVMFTQGIGASSMVLCFALARENNPAWASGATIGVINSFVVGSGAILQPILGWMLDARWDGALRDNARIYSVEAYAEVLPILPATCFLGTALVFLVKESWGRHQVED
jgi:MFS family permease